MIDRRDKELFDQSIDDDDSTKNDHHPLEKYKV